MSKLNIGLVGYGNASRVFHLPFINHNPLLHVYAFFQRSPPGPNVARHCTIDYPHAKHYTELDEFLKDDGIDLVVVVTKHDTHAEFAERALLAGKHVVVEKPVAVSSKEFERVIAASKQSGKLLFPFQSRRYDSDFQTLLKLHRAGVFGEYHDVQIHYDIDMPSWLQGAMPGHRQPGSGMNFGIGCHSLDQALTLFGKPSTVNAYYRNLRGDDSDIEDSFQITLEYPNSPLIVNVSTNVATKLRHQLKYFVRGFKGTFIKFGDDRQEDQINAGMQPGDERFGVEPESMWGRLSTATKVFDFQQERDGIWEGTVKSEISSIGNFYEDVRKAIAGEIEQVIRPETSLYGLRIIELALESVKQGKRLDFDL